MIGGACSLVVTRSRGCRPNVTSKEVADEVIEEVRGLVAAVDRDRAAAVRLAQIIRRETLDDRNLVALARSDELDFADALARLVGR
jgi:hypothetical protein